MPARYLEDIIEWDVVNWSQALDFWKIHTRLNLNKARALELGSRNGGLSLWLALMGAQVFCTDLGGPSHRAMRKFSAFHVSHRIRCGSLDAVDIPYEDYFNVVAFKSMLGAVGRNGMKSQQVQAVQQMATCLKDNGELFFAENLVASPLHRKLRSRFTEWGDNWRYVTKEEMLEFLAPFSTVKYNTCGFLGAFGRTEKQRNFLGRLDRSLFSSIVPDSWHYIIYGVAKKISPPQTIAAEEGD